MSQRWRRNRFDDDEEMPRPSQRGRKSTVRASQLSQAGPSGANGYDDVPMSGSSQRSNAAKAVMPEDEKNHLVTSVIRYLFVADRNKTLIQRIHIVKNAMDNNGKYFKYIISEVTKTLKDAFGHNLVELEGNKFILTNDIANDDLHLQYTNDEKAELVLLFITLSHLFMIDESGCREEELFNLFRSLEIVEDDNFIHDYFGNVKYLITEKFVKQGYLELVKVDTSDPPVEHYQWGPRAENELEPRNVLEFISKIFGGRPLNTWPGQFKRMEAREKLAESS